jgi:CheY-like chemotaxis protein
MPTVLVVDDSELDRRLAAGLLESSSYEVSFAENGVKALEEIDRKPPNLILTDLQMPQMDGLELVTNARIQAPQIPIVLMTAHGSETIAAEALQRGAASYVAKSELATKLLSTLDEIAALQRADRSYRRLVDCSTQTEFDFELPSDTAMIDPLVDLTQQMLRSLEICDSNGELQIGVALEQAIQNAMIRGNLGLGREQLESSEDADALIRERQHKTPYSERRVFIRLKMNREEAVFEIRDQGDGFDHRAVDGGIDTATNQRGRGLVLMKTFMDEVQFHGNGCTVRMVKRRPR